MRPMAVRGLRREAVRKSSGGGDARQAWDAPGRSFCAMRTTRDIHDGLRTAFELGGVRTRSGVASAVSWSRTDRFVNCLRAGLNATSSLGTGSTFCSPQRRYYSQSTAAADESMSLPEQVRNVMRMLPHSVVVCTATHNGTPRAMTMSSFTSLTLSPTPLITFNVAVPSRTLDAIAASREFNIHVLAGDEAGAAVAHHFTRGNVGDDVFDGVEWAGSTGQGGDAPRLTGEGVLRVLRCRVLADAPADGLVRVRDHVIVVGEVLDTVPGKDRTEFGLAYAERRYREVGGKIDVKA